MDILKPPIICIDGRCYRQNTIQKPQEWAEQDEGEEEDLYNDYQTEETCDLLDLRETEKGYSLAVEMPCALFGHIIGKKGETRQRIQRETKTRLVIPSKSKKEVDDIVIHGEQRAGIVSAKTRIDVIIASARQREPFTHMLTIPFNLPTVQAKFEEFKEDVLRGSRGDEGLDASLFQKPAKLHLTIGILVLMSRKEVAQAQEILEKCKEEIISPILGDSFLLVKLGGLDYMNDDPGKVDVLYAKASAKDGSNKLQLICDSITDRFICAGLMQKEYDRVKVHITLMNTVFRREPDAEDTGKERGKEKGPRKERMDKGRESFDASRILKDFGDYSFGDCLISSIQISQRGSYGGDGYYLPVGSIALP